jgi:hypothetical protein
LSPLKGSSVLGCARTKCKTMICIHVPKIRCSEAHPVLFLDLLHTIWQTVLGPPILHKPFCYPTNLPRKILKNQSIAEQRQFLKLRKMFTPFPASI